LRALRAWLTRLAASFGMGPREAELVEELQSHLAMHVADNERAGMPPDEARRQAVLKLGGVIQVRESYRDRARLPAVDHLFQDLRVGARMLRRNPTFAAIAVLTLGLGIGANAAIFSLFNAVLLRPLPYPDPDRLVLIWATNTRTGDTEDVASYPDVEDWRSSNRSFVEVAAFTTRDATLAGGEQAELVPALQVTPGFFETLGIMPAIGRVFDAADQAAASRVAIVSDRAWKRRFAARSDVLGRTLRINEQSCIVIGVMPPGFAVSPDDAEDLYTLLPRETERNHGYLRVVARLRPDVSLEAAQSDMDRITGEIARQFPRSNRDVGANVVPLVDALASDVKPALVICLGVVAIVLLIACTNVANLLLARGAARQREMALRTALGAGRRRLMQQLLTESLLIALAGGALGLLLATWTAPLLAAMLGEQFPIPRLETTRTDASVLTFTLLVSLSTAILIGILHAATVRPFNQNGALRESSPTTTTDVRFGRVRNALVVVETALALILLAGAGALLKSLVGLTATAPGFTPANGLAVSVRLPPSRTEQKQAQVEYYETVVGAVERVPGVQSAALVSSLPLGGGYDSLGFLIPGRPAPQPRGYFSANFNIVSAGYFRTMGIPIRAGREFSDRDSPAAARAIVINETAARRFWTGEDPLGREITLPPAETPLMIVGIVGDVRQMSLGSASRPEFYLNFVQPGPDWPHLTLVIRTATDPSLLLPAVRTAVRSADRDVPVDQIGTLDEVLSASVAEPRVYTLLLGAFATLALALAAVGLYGVVAYAASQRTHEMGVRQALGAARGDILKLVMRQGLTLSLVGTVIGLMGALAVTRLLTRLVSSLEPGDPLTLAGVSALLMLVALAATFVPAARASRVDPLVALRYE
jgi:putative ABC transport system permease protein